MALLQADPYCIRCKLCETTERVCIIPPTRRREVAVIGEAPGGSEELTGQLFSGPAGKLLNRVLEENDLDRDELFITNAVSCRPPENRTPNKKEINACKFWLDSQLAEVRPKYVLLLGAVPLQSVLGLKGIKKLRGKPIEKDGVIYLPTYHPAFILRDERYKGLFESDIRFFSEIVNKGKIPVEEGLNFTIVRTHTQFREMLEDLYGDVSYDIETTGLYPWAEDAKINTLGFGTAKNQWILPAEHKESCWTRDKIIELLKTLRNRTLNDELKFICQNGKFDMLYTWVRYNIRFDTDFDTMLAHYLIDENQLHGLKYLSQVYFGAMDYDIGEDLKLGKLGITKEFAYYQACDLYYTRKLKPRLVKQLDADKDIRAVFDNILMPCSNLFQEIEHNGVYINLEKMDDAEKYLRDRIKEAERDLARWIPKDLEDMNWGSPKQVADLLYNRLGIPIVSKTKKGAPSTSESALNMIDHPMVADLLKARGAKQQLSFFIEGWKPFLDGRRLHPNFKLSGTVTGRPSCEHPNLQQVPRDRRIRSLIGAPPGWDLLEADLSQIELRIAAELSGDSNMTAAFMTGTDPHWLTAIREIQRSGAKKKLVLATASALMKEDVPNYGDACQIILKAGNAVCEEIFDEWKELRKKAKAINFGYLYGMWWKKFKMYARDNYGVEVSDEQAEASREAFFELYDELSDWHKRQKKFARTHGYVRSLSGRKRRLPAAQHRDNTPERKEAERQAINSPVQGFASELNLMAALQLRREFSKTVLRIVGTVHDAILMEVRRDMVPTVYKRVTEIMSHPELLDTLGIKLRIPIEAECKIGDWSTGISLKKWKEKISA